MKMPRNGVPQEKRADNVDRLDQVLEIGSGGKEERYSPTAR